jgi:glycosyltransferase involved in cell wall biosynthesis
VKQKGHKLLLDAMPAIIRRFPKARLLLVGQGAEEANLKAQVGQLGIGASVTFLGRRDDVRDLLHLSSAFAFPSVCAEGLPVAVIEAMAAGKPCVAWNVWPNPEVIEQGVSGLLVPPHEVQAFAEAVISVAEDTARGRRMGERGRLIIQEKFNLHRTVRQLEGHYCRWLQEVRRFENEITTSYERSVSLLPGTCRAAYADAGRPLLRRVGPGRPSHGAVDL